MESLGLQRGSVDSYHYDGSQKLNTSIAFPRSGYIQNPTERGFFISPSLTGYDKPFNPITGELRDPERVSSRPRWTNGKNHENGQDEQLYKNETSPPSDGTVLSYTEGERLREEATYSFKNYRVARAWNRVVFEWQEWMDRYDDLGLKFENENGDVVTGDMENSYHPSYAKRTYAKIKTFEEQIGERWGDDATTVMLTFTTSTTDDDGNQRPPADHLRELKQSWRNNARQTLYNRLEGVEWEYCTILEPHKSGYAHFHVALFVNGDIVRDDLEAVRNSHVDNAPNADIEAHGMNQFASVNKNAYIGNLGSYLTAYLGADFDDPREADYYKRKFYALCWATGTQRARFSRGANRMVSEAWDDNDQRDLSKHCECEHEGPIDLWDTLEIYDCEHWKRPEIIETDADGEIKRNWPITDDKTDPFVVLRPPPD